jgi:hypothetical protein
MVATTIGIYFVPVKKLVARSKVGEGGELHTPRGRGILAKATVKKWGFHTAK